MLMERMICDTCPVHICVGCEVVPYDTECDNLRTDFNNKIKNGECRFSCRYYDWSVGSCEGDCQVDGEVEYEEKNS